MKFRALITSAMGTASFGLFLTGCGISDGRSLIDNLAPELTFTNGQAAYSVIGQADFVSRVSSSSANGLGSAYAVDVDAKGVLRIADQTNSRIVGFNTIPTTTSPTANFVLGQTGFNLSATGNNANQLNNPTSGSSGAGKYFISDYANNRVLIYNSLPTTGNPNADVAIGAGSTNVAGTGSCTATTLFHPTQAITVNGKLILADYENNRVLIYNSIPTTSGATPDLVLGQTSLTSCNPSATASGLHEPTSIWSDGTRLVVSDRTNNRVLVWNSFPTTNGQAADMVLGQPDFNTVTPGTASTVMHFPIAVVVDSYGKLFASEQGNNRVLIWNSFPTRNQQPADVVLGQTDMTLALAPNPPTATSLSSPGLITFSGSFLMVADYSNNRVLFYRSTSSN